jgi:hypothetical protein
MNGNCSTSTTCDESNTPAAKPPVLRQQALFAEHDPRWLALINRVIEAELPDEELANASLFQGELFEAEPR